MLLIDDIVLSPFKGLLWVFEEIHKNAVETIEGEGERIRNELTELYMLLETEQIDEDEFDRREAALLERLDRIEAQLGDDDEELDELDELDEDREDEAVEMSGAAERSRHELEVED